MNGIGCGPHNPFSQAKVMGMLSALVTAELIL